MKELGFIVEAGEEYRRGEIVKKSLEDIFLEITDEKYIKNFMNNKKEEA